MDPIDHSEPLAGNRIAVRHRRWASVGGIVALAVVSVPGVSQAETPTRPGVGIVLPDNPLGGRLLYESKQCVRCHGIAGDGPGIGPILGEGQFSGTFMELGAALWNHVPGMTVTFEVTGLDWPRLTSRETVDLVSFLYFIDYLGRPGVADDGRKVFDSGCGPCHVVGGGEANIGPDLAELSRFASPLSVAREIWNHGPSMFESMRQKEVESPHFEDGDLADLSAYIRQEAGPGPRQPLLSTPGNPNAGRGLFRTKGCAACHGSDARGGRGGHDLASVELRSSAEAIAAAMWNHGSLMNDAMEERGSGWPEFEGSEFADLVAFLYFIPFLDPPGDPARGALVFTDRSCSSCHARGAEGAERDLPGPVLEGSSMAASQSALVSAMWNHAPNMKEAILGDDLPWPELSGDDLRDLRAYFDQSR